LLPIDKNLGGISCDDSFGTIMNTDKPKVTNEIVLFHVDDPLPAVVFSGVSSQLQFDLCMQSIARRSQSSRVTLLTDSRTDLRCDNSSLSILRSEVSLELLMLERTRLYLEHVRRRANEGALVPITLMDIDILVARDLGGVFDGEDFDVGLTVRFPPGLVLDDDGLPVNTMISPINGGVIFVRPNAASVAFFEEMLSKILMLHKKGVYAPKLAGDIRKWGGDQFALMHMLGKRLIADRPNVINHAGVKVRFFSCETHNYSPDTIGEISRDRLSETFILHLKGPRKDWMPGVARWML
jgi:hypothetical protein